MKGRYFVARRHGALFLVDIYNYVDRQIEAYGLYEKRQVAQLVALMDLLRPDVFIDVGANSGMYSIVLAKQFPQMGVICFEPDRRCAAQLSGNLFLNNLEDRVEVHEFALSDTNGESKFSRFPDENRGRSAIRESGEFKVRTALLDDVCDLSGSRIAIKMDVEGHELNVVKGAMGLLSGNDCVLQIECFSAVAELEGVLKAVGYARVQSVGNDHYFAKGTGVGEGDARGK
jgi:FkbM family methyltransferase